MYRLFDEYAHRYDLHTPPHHYQDDHELVLALARERRGRCRLLDVGCGTGVLVAKALEAGIDARGFDASARMIAVARERVPATAVYVGRMEALSEVDTCDIVVSLSWSIHYCETHDSFTDVLQRMRNALIPGGALLLQVAHAPNMASDWRVDSEPGPAGVPGQVSLAYRFRRHPTDPARLRADYIYRSPHHGEIVSETHILQATDINLVCSLLAELGFRAIESWNSFRRDPFTDAGSGFIYARA